MSLSVTVAPALGSSRRLPILDALRGYAILLVVLYHTNGLFGRSNWLHLEVGVDIFLLVSGFSLALGAATLTAGQFWTRRFLRLFPKYWIALVLFVALESRYFRNTHSWLDILLHATGLHALVPAYFSSINDSFWFISLIVMLYAAFWLLRKNLDDPLALAGWGMLLSATTFGYFSTTKNDGGIIQFASRIPSFFLGLIAGRCWSASKLILRPCWPFYLGATGLLFAYLLQGFVAYYPILAVGALTPVALAYPSATRFAASRFVFLVFGFLGRYSYEIFLFHQPLIRDYSPHLLRFFYPLDPKQIPPWIQLASGLGMMAFLILVIVAVEKTWARLDFAARRKVCVAGLLLGIVAALWPLETFIWKHCQLHFAATRALVHEKITSRIDYAGYPGPVRLRVTLPRVENPLGSPLIVTGRTGEGDIVHIICVGTDRYVLAFDHWGQPMCRSPILTLHADRPHDIVVSLGSLLAPNVGPEYSALKKILFVSVDGGHALNLSQTFYPSLPATCFFGTNPVGGSTALAAYEGQIISRENVLPSEILRSVAAHTPLHWVYLER